MKYARRKDPVLPETMQGWPESAPEGLVTFHNRRNELSVHHGCVVSGVRVVVPQKLRPQLLEELHTRNLGVVKMKAQAAVTYGGQVATVILNSVRICHSRHPCSRGSGHLHPGREYTFDYACPFFGHMHICNSGRCSLEVVGSNHD